MDNTSILAWLADALVARVGEVVTGDCVVAARRRVGRRPPTARINALTAPTEIHATYQQRSANKRGTPRQLTSPPACSLLPLQYDDKGEQCGAAWVIRWKFITTCFIMALT